jgi:hypothetical protein
MRIVQSLLGPGGGRLSRNLRLLCTQLWPTVYRTLIVSGEDPIATWSLSKEQAVRRLPDGPREPAQLFLDSLARYYPSEQDITVAQKMAASRQSLLAEAKQWYDTRAVR